MPYVTGKLSATIKPHRGPSHCSVLNFINTTVGMTMLQTILMNGFSRLVGCAGRVITFLPATVTESLLASNTRHMILLGLNIDHCATLRQARYRDAGGTTGGAVEPDPVTFALLGERAGADGITVHLR